MKKVYIWSRTEGPGLVARRHSSPEKASRKKFSAKIRLSFLRLLGPEYDGLYHYSGLGLLIVSLEVGLRLHRIKILVSTRQVYKISGYS